MADEDDANNLGDDGDIDVGASKKGKASPITHLLKYVLIGIVAIIFIVTIVLITQSFTNSDESRAAPIASSEEYTITRETLDWYTSLDQVRTQTSDDIPASVNVTLALGYKKDDKQASSFFFHRHIPYFNLNTKISSPKIAISSKYSNILSYVRAH